MEYRCTVEGCRRRFQTPDWDNGPGLAIERGWRFALFWGGARKILCPEHHADENEQLMAATVAAMRARGGSDTCLR